jgi:hypothetical protein
MLQQRRWCLCVVAVLGAALSMGFAAGGEPEAPVRRVPAKVRKVIRDLRHEDDEVRRAAVGRIRLGDPHMEEAAGDIADLLDGPRAVRCSLSPDCRWWDAVDALRSVGHAGSSALRRKLGGAGGTLASLDLALALRSVADGVERLVAEGKPHPGRSARELLREAALARRRVREAYRDGLSAADPTVRLVAAEYALRLRGDAPGLLPLLAHRALREENFPAACRLLLAMRRTDPEGRYCRPVYAAVAGAADRRPEHAAAAALVLGASGPGSLRDIAWLLRHRSPKVRAAALRGVPGRGGALLLPLLWAPCLSRDADERENALWAVERVLSSAVEEAKEGLRKWRRR